jgi:DNA-binding response OmpR family regulator
MKKCILWIEDDYFDVKGLVYSLSKEGFKIDVATSAVQGFEKAQNWQAYDLIIVDLILPLADDIGTLPEKVQSWAKEQHTGIGLLKWLKTELKAECPVMMLSVVREPISRFNLENLGLAGYLPKRGLLPSQVKEEVFKILKVQH